jgi:hypothetical protein
VVSAVPGIHISPEFAGTAVGPQITRTKLENGVINIFFQGGILQTADELGGEWEDTEDDSGLYSEAIGTNQMRFFRVLAP